MRPRCQWLVLPMTTSNVISGRVPTCDIAQLWRIYSAASIMTWDPNESRNLDTESTSPCHILIMPSSWVGSDKYQFLNHWFDPTRVWTRGFEFHGLPKREMESQVIRSSYKTTMRAHRQKWTLWTLMFLGCKTPKNKQSRETGNSTPCPTTVYNYVTS